MNTVEQTGTAYAVDDDPMFLDALSMTLESAGLDVRAYRSCRDFLRENRADGASCLVLDINMPDVDGLQLQRLLAAQNDPIPIVFVTGHADVSTSVRALRNGAVDFLEKPVDGDDLLKSVEQALSRDRRRREADRQRADVTRRFTTLTARERQIMKLVASDNSSKEIARDLDISPRTVEHHRAHIMRKMNANSLNELIIMAVMCGVRELRL
ncbi:MAG: response regulator transcription factor [Gammaproteobacteria bacterium]|nr:response regulator transcription factor [Gammaproteobacteria bacterium]